MKKWTPKHVNWLKALKIAAGAVAAILLAEALGLQNAASAGIITLLTVQNTRRETVMSSVRRFSGFAMMTLLCLPIYHFCGTAPWAFGIVLLLLLLICESRGGLLADSHGDGEGLTLAVNAEGELIARRTVGYD